jgi:hypothetical protein
MNTAVTEKLKRMSSELRQLDLELKTEARLDPLSLVAFREALDSVRLTAWSKAELISARSAEKDPNSIVTFLVSERLRRFEQMVNNICADFDRGAIPFQDYVLIPLLRGINALHQRVKKKPGTGG